MAVPNPNLQNLPGLVFLMSPEPGMIIDGFDYNSSCTMDWVYDASVGYDVGYVAFNYEISGSVKGKISSTSGLGSAIPGAVLTLGNSTSLNGITTGSVICTGVSGSHSEKAFREITVPWIKKPGVVVTP